MILGIIVLAVLPLTVAEEKNMSVTVPTEPIENFVSDVSFIIDEFSSAITKLVTVFTKALISIGRAIYISLIIIGFILRTTRISWRLGWELIKGGVFLAILTEIVIPILRSYNILSF